MLHQCHHAKKTLRTTRGFVGKACVCCEHDGQGIHNPDDLQDGVSTHMDC